jgi:hypothetical protein
MKMPFGADDPDIRPERDDPLTLKVVKDSRNLPKSVTFLPLRAVS